MRIRIATTCALRSAALGALLLLLAAAPAAAQQKLEFDHFRTGFPLTGSHERVPCEACHTGGVFEGTPKGCGECHQPGSTRAATFKPPDHIPTSNRCADCHMVTTWSSVRFDHRDVSGACASCHNGAMAQGKPANHIVTTADCGVCHRTLSWTPAHFDHQGITTGCFQCHNGTTATGKPASHPPTSNDWEQCHNTRSFADATFDHSKVTGNCMSCHNGTTATGKGSGHFVTSQDCNACHTTTRWTPTIAYRHVSPYYVDHGTRVSCQQCHTTNTEIATWPFAGFKPDCAGCHFNNFRPGAHLKTETPQTYYTAAELRDCKGACHTYRDATLTTIVRSRTGHHNPRQGSWD